MTDNRGDGIHEPMEEFDEGHEYFRRAENSRRRESVFGFKPGKKTMILAGACLVFLILLVAVFSREDERIQATGVDSMQGALSRLEEGLKQLEGLEEKLAAAAKQEKQWGDSVKNLAETDRRLSQRIDTLSQEIAGLRAEKPSSYPERESPISSEKKANHQVKNRYYEVRIGDTLYGIARRHGISVEALCRINGITPKEVIHAGQKLLVHPGNQQ